eukprot:124701_1
MPEPQLIEENSSQKSVVSRIVQRHFDNSTKNFKVAKDDITNVFGVISRLDPNFDGKEFWRNFREFRGSKVFRRPLHRTPREVSKRAHTVRVEETPLQRDSHHSINRESNNLTVLSTPGATESPNMEIDSPIMSAVVQEDVCMVPETQPTPKKLEFCDDRIPDTPLSFNSLSNEGDAIFDSDVSVICVRPSGSPPKKTIKNGKRKKDLSTSFRRMSISPVPPRYTNR